jgi:hypothetical protein
MRTSGEDAMNILPRALFLRTQENRCSPALLAEEREDRLRSGAARQRQDDCRGEAPTAFAQGSAQVRRVQYAMIASEFVSHRSNSRAGWGAKEDWEFHWGYPLVMGRPFQGSR